MSNFNLLCEPIKNGIVNKLKWRELTQIQELSIPEIIAGKNVLLLANTAGGKTEAAFLPALHTVFEEKIEGTSILYVSPIKALLNNQEERLRILSSFIYGNVFKWHGDVENGEKAKFFKSLSTILMITPESLEVILMNKTINKNVFFKNIRYIIIDEIHSFADSERGVQLMAILERIQQFSNHDIQRIGLSATVGNTKQICTWMQGGSQRESIVIIPPKEKKNKMIEIKILQRQEDFADEVCKRIYGKKSLFFSNSRTGAEGLKNNIESKGIKALVHHSSIDKQFREMAEERFKIGTNTCIIATSTLELGIDIGNLDVVLQLDSPNSVSSFLQRMGRTGRRKDSVAHFIFFPTKPEKFLLALGILNMAIKGWVEDVFVSNICYDLMFQQIINMSLANFGIDKDYVYDVLSKAYPFSGINHKEYEFLIRYMIQKKFLQIDRNKIYIDDETEKVFGRQNFMALYSAFETNKEFTVKFRNRNIGTLERWFVNALGKNFQFILAGKYWQTDKIDYDKSIIYVVEAKSAMPPRWLSGDGFISYELAQEMRNILTSDVEYAFLNNYEKKYLDNMRYEEQSFGLRMNKIMIEETKDGYDFYTYAGNAVNYTLAKTIIAISSNLDSKSITWKGFKIKALDKDFKPKCDEIFEFINNIKKDNKFLNDMIPKLKDLVPDIPLSKYQKYLPSELRKKMLLDYVYDIERTQLLIENTQIELLKML